MCMNFLLVEWKNDDDFSISGEEKIMEFFMNVEEKRRGVAEQ